MTNGTRVEEFILLGLTDDPNLEILIFLLLFSTYLLTIMGNVLIIAITLVDHHLYTPMYFFLRHVAFVEIGYTTTIIPKTLANMAKGHKTISVIGCFTQSYLYFSLGTTEFFLLAVMSVDRYVAVCNPLRYSTIINGQICPLLVLCCWVAGFLLILGPAATLFQMPFCGSNIINHFFCDNGPLLKLVCADTNLLELVSFLSAILSLIGTLAINLVSYVHIISSVLHIPSTAGRQKTFSTCSSHITVVSITYGSCIFLYVKPKGTSRLDFSKSVAVLNTVISPLLIPFIYCLRNKQVKTALIGAFRQGLVLCKAQDDRRHQHES
ncbi:PREDICTED: olfactory receptor 49-like [Gekko japonicus]|uniref:Olfactory receptor n=1 Tax=Gekko japonicus TaxID=146911 RepID=A0ABM1K971_GEKJA|nr:PREDICTED: olfactory receptor 49-like [Gekko japonicus]